MLGEKFSHLGLDRLRQQRARPVAQNLGERVGKRPWLKQLDHGSIGHGVSLLCWRSGGSNTPTIRRLLPVSPSPTSAHSSDYYNHQRYHESIDNLTPADVYFGRGPTILAERERIKRQTIAERRLQHQLQA